MTKEAQSKEVAAILPCRRQPTLILCADIAPYAVESAERHVEVGSIYKNLDNVSLQSNSADVQSH